VGLSDDNICTAVPRKRLFNLTLKIPIMYTPILQQISNHPGINLSRMVETEVFFKKDRILLFCRCFYVDTNNQQIESIPERLYTFSSFGIMVNPINGETVNKDPQTDQFPVGSISYNDYLALIPNELPNSTTSYGNILVFVKSRVSALDQEQKFN